MLSAVRKEEPLDMSYTDQTATSPGGFGKMLNSLHGLQQRLDDFSIADVTNAEANARTLILRLKQFQATISAIALVKKAEANIDQSIAEIRHLDTEVVGMDSLENHPQLHSIVKASKLIKLHKLMAALKAGNDVGEFQENSSLAPATAPLTSVERSVNFLSETFDVPRSDRVDHEIPSRPEPANEAAQCRQELEQAPLNAATIVSSSVSEIAADSAIAAAKTSDTAPLKNDSLADFPTADVEFETAIAATTMDSPIAEGLFPEFPAPAEPLTDGQLSTAPPTVELTTSLPPLVKRKQEAQIEPAKKSKARKKEPAPLVPSKALVPANESFDLRLLDDLVSNYGEFASNANLPATVKKREIQSVISAANDAHEAEPEHSVSVEAVAPAVRKHGDLDRQLKKIIKDYGEYDIYSDKQTANIKKAGILAFVFLGLVFGGIYFFKAPPSTAKTAPAASNSNSATPDEQKPRIGAAETHGDSRDTAPGSIQNHEKTTAKNK